jgi:hypothetical protein
MLGGIPELEEELVPSGAFNVAALIKELGLQALTGEEMRVLEQIQPVMNVGDLGDVTPPHVAPTALFGKLTQGGVGTFPGVQLQCLAPGGGFIEWVTFESTDLGLMRVTTKNPGLANVVAKAGQVSRDPVVSVCTDGNGLALGNHVTISTAQAFLNFAPRPMFIPRGSFFSIFGSEAGAVESMRWGFSWREVPASEYAPT